MVFLPAYQVGISIGYILMASSVNHLPRRGMGAAGAFAMAVALFSIGVVWSVVDYGEVEGGFFGLLSYYVPPVAAVLFTAAYGVTFIFIGCLQSLTLSFSTGGGFGGMAWTMSSELFPPRVKSLGCSICVVFRFIVVFILLKVNSVMIFHGITSLYLFLILQVYPHLLHLLGSAQIVILHGGACLAAAAFIACCMPETKGLTTYQITHLFAKHNIKIPNFDVHIEKGEFAKEGAEEGREESSVIVDKSSVYFVDDEDEYDDNSDANNLTVTTQATIFSSSSASTCADGEIEAGYPSADEERGGLVMKEAEGKEEK